MAKHSIHSRKFRMKFRIEKDHEDPPITQKGGKGESKFHHRKISKRGETKKNH